MQVKELTYGYHIVLNNEYMKHKIIWGSIVESHSLNSLIKWKALWFRLILDVCRLDC